MTLDRPVRPRSAHPLAGPLVHLDRTGSTNDRARELALGGAPDGTVVLAEEQAAGRGRQGRAWLAPRGRTLTLSVLVRRNEVALVAALELMPAAVALAVCEACENVAKVACVIKWPNDVWVRERKLAGILIESRPQAGWAVIGIGLNVNTVPDELGPELRESATSLRIESDAPVNRDRALGALLDRLSASLEELERQGRNDLLAAYRKRDLLRGRQIRWAAGRASLHGEAQGIDERGRLVVFTDSGERLLLEAGEVHLNIESASPNT